MRAAVKRRTLASSGSIAPSWMAAYRRDWIGADVLGGLTVAAIVIPKAMAYATIAGLPVQAGLYTALAAMLVYPLLGTSRALSTSTTSALAMLTATQVLAHAPAGDQASAVAVAATLAMLVGVFLLLARLLRLGFLANFISKPVLIGFEAGIGVVIIVGQLKSVLGIDAESAGSVDTLLVVAQNLPEAHAHTVLVALAGAALLLTMPRLLPKVPAPLLCIVLGIAASAALGLSAMGVKLVGFVPAGLPSLHMPDFSLVQQLWPAALGIALMSFTESVAAGRTFLHRGDPPVVPNRELVAVGAANLAAAVAGGMPAGGGTSQTSVADDMGVRSQLAQWVNAGAVLLTLSVFSALIGLLPQAVLAAVILVAAVAMIKPANFRAIARVRRDELVWALVTAAGVVLIGTLEGIAIAVAVSVLTLVYQANHPPVYAVAWSRSKDVFRRLGEDAADETFPGLLLLRTEGRLTFANADTVADKMRALVAQWSPQVIVLECSAIPDIEYTALAMLTDAERQLRERGVELWLAGVNPDLRRILDRSELGHNLGPERVHFNLYRALAAWHARLQTGSV